MIDKTIMLNLICNGCGRHFLRKRRKHKRCYCSRECFYKNMEITEAKQRVADMLGRVYGGKAKRPWDGKTRPEFRGKKHPFFGKHHSVSTRAILREKSKKAYERGDFAHTPILIAMSMWGKHTKPKSPLYQRIRICFRNREWRRRIMARDNFTCRHCGRKGGYLEAHHLTPFVKICIANNISSLKEAFECRELWETDNGITLCLPCHQKTRTKVP